MPRDLSSCRATSSAAVCGGICSRLMPSAARQKTSVFMHGLWSLVPEVIDRRHDRGCAACDRRLDCVAGLCSGDEFLSSVGEEPGQLAVAVRVADRLVVVSPWSVEVEMAACAGEGDVEETSLLFKSFCGRERHVGGDAPV